MATILPSGVLQKVAAGGGAEDRGNARQALPASGNSLPSNSAVSSGAPKVSREDAAEAVAEVTRRLSVAGTSLSISVDEQLGSTIIKVTDKETDEVIRQIPPERIVNLARFMRESSSEGGFELADTMKGLMLDSQG